MTPASLGLVFSPAWSLKQPNCSSPPSSSISCIPIPKVIPTIVEQLIRKFTLEKEWLLLRLGQISGTQGFFRRPRLTSKPINGRTFSIQFLPQYHSRCWSPESLFSFFKDTDTDHTLTFSIQWELLAILGLCSFLFSVHCFHSHNEEGTS